MFNLILFEPEIAPNTGNIIRLCANTGSSLHLIRPLGFTLNDKRLRRAGLDYREYAEITEHDTLQLCLRHLGQPRLLAISTRGQTAYSEHAFAERDAILFGPETRGLPVQVLESLPASRVLRIPMQPDSRSLNLSNAAAVVVYEAWRQLGFQ
ncbi:MAG: tRNA (cytidine(34)-2'-O)-methyltransferase [Gammaproteobacteria bacterium]|jgi:tRNA (cytidine/uridine-2'-O-)-methyltransferase|nr:tRNA (cytidine(34)-2'-O)-methyltransferase [Gammaproteobacteria bacterium]